MTRSMTPAGWWGLVGMLALLGDALYRLGPIAAEAVTGDLSAGQRAALVSWVVIMAWTEGWRGFHLRFSPMVVARCQTLDGSSPRWHRVLAPVYAMGLIHATPRRKRVSWGLTIGIVLLIILVRELPDPWRGIIDAGVVVGLSIGALSMLYWLRQGLAGADLVDPEVPDGA